MPPPTCLENSLKTKQNKEIKGVRERERGGGGGGGGEISLLSYKVLLVVVRKKKTCEKRNAP